MNIIYGHFGLSWFKKISIVCLLSYVKTNTYAQMVPPDTGTGISSIPFFITPIFSTTETWTDNLFSESGAKRSGTITEISPGINIQKETGRIKGYLNYSLNILNYSDGDNNNKLQNSLNSSIRTEVIDGHGFIDINGYITQQTISAFSVQTNDGNKNNSNKTEVSTYSLVPYYRGRLADILDYEAKYSLTSTKAKSNKNFSSNDSLASLNLNGNEFFGRLSWTLGANHEVVMRDVGPDTEIDGFKLSLIYPLTNKLILSVSGGRISENYSSAKKEGSWTSGVGLNWSISERSRLTTSIENNPLGKVYSVNFEHRTPRTSWSVSDVKSVSLSNSFINRGLGNIYDLLLNQNPTIKDDPIKSAQFINNYLQANGISPNSVSINGYLTSGNSLQRTQNIAFALLGIRDTITFTAGRSVGKRISTSSFTADDFNNSSSIRQDGFSVSYTHRLTQDTVCSSQFSNQKIHGDISAQESDLKYVNISTSTRVGNKTYLTVSARHSVSSSTSSPYRETAVIGNLTLQF